MNILLLPSATRKGKIAMTYCNISLGFTNIKRGQLALEGLIATAAGYVRCCHEIHTQTSQQLLPLSPAYEASGVSQCDGDGLPVKEVADNCL